MKDFADIEIGISRIAQVAYAVDFRFRLPNSSIDSYLGQVHWVEFKFDYKQSVFTS